MSTNLYMIHNLPIYIHVIDSFLILHILLFLLINEVFMKA